MKLPEMSNTRRRVKLYVLNDERQWDDHGTGHVSSMYVDHEKMQGIVLLVRSEDDGKRSYFGLVSAFDSLNSIDVWLHSNPHRLCIKDLAFGC